MGSLLGGGARVPAKYGSSRRRVEIDAIESLRRLFAGQRAIRGKLRGSVVAV